jgi:hypothetical protein
MQSCGQRRAATISVIQMSPKRSPDQHERANEGNRSAAAD